MKCYYHDKSKYEYIETKEEDPECMNCSKSGDFCGDCLVSYSEDSCLSSDDGRHLLVKLI